MLKELLTEKAQEVIAEQKLDNRDLAQHVFKTMDHILNQLEKVDELLNKKAVIVDMDKLGLVHERESVVKRVEEAIREFEDFMPGLEMQSRGED